jgi:ABC-type lipoprotein release transport system permease subunit
MGFLAKLAYRNLTRHKARTILTFVAISFGVGMFIWFDGFMTWASERSLRNVKKYEVSHMKLYKRDYYEEKDFHPVTIDPRKGDAPFRYSLPQSGTLLRDIEQLGDVQACRRLVFTGSVSARGRLFPFTVFAVEPERDRTVYDISDRIATRVKDGQEVPLGEYRLRGRSRDHPEAAPTCLLGLDIARDLDVRVGDSVLLSYKTKYGRDDAIMFIVAGMLATTNPYIDKGGIVVNFGLMQEAMQMAEHDEANVMSVRVKSGREADMRAFYRELSSQTTDRYMKRRGNIQDLLARNHRGLFQDYAARLRGRLEVAGYSRERMSPLLALTRRYGTETLKRYRRYAKALRQPESGDEQLDAIEKADTAYLNRMKKRLAALTGEERPGALFSLVSEGVRDIRQYQRDLIEPPVKLVYWRTLASSALAAIQGDKQGTGVMLLMIFIISAVGIVNTVLLAVYERIREIGMMRALGMRNRDVIISFMMEAAGIGLLGGVAGALIGLAAVLATKYIGWDFTELAGEIKDFGYRVDPVFRAVVVPLTYVAAMVFAMLVTSVISFLPARKAVKMKVTDAVRYH